MFDFVFVNARSITFCIAPIMFGDEFAMRRGSGNADSLTNLDAEMLLSPFFDQSYATVASVLEWDIRQRS